MMVILTLLTLVWSFVMVGFYTLQPNQAAMVSNLLVVLCGQVDAQPVINTGTLYT